MTYNIRSYFNLNRIKQDKKLNGAWSSLFLHPETGRICSEKDYINCSFLPPFKKKESKEQAEEALTSFLNLTTNNKGEIVPIKT